MSRVLHAGLLVSFLWVLSMTSGQCMIIFIVLSPSWDRVGTSDLRPDARPIAAARQSRDHIDAEEQCKGGSLFRP